MYTMGDENGVGNASMKGRGGDKGDKGETQGEYQGGHVRSLSS